MPNKLFEYLAAGVVPIVMNAKEPAEYVKKHDIGVVVDSIDELCYAVTNNLLYHTYLKKVMEKREQFLMDSQVPKIIKLYEKVLGRKIQ